MFGHYRKPDPLLLLSLFVGVAALFTTAVSASEPPGSIVANSSSGNSVTEFNLPFVSGFDYEDRAGFAIAKNRKGHGVYMSFTGTDDMRNTFLKTGVSERGLKDLMDVDVKLSYKVSW